MNLGIIFKSICGTTKAKLFWQDLKDNLYNCHPNIEHRRNLDALLLQLCVNHMVRIELRYNSSKESEYVISLGNLQVAFITAKYTAKYTARQAGNNSVASSNSEHWHSSLKANPIRH